jgi:ankyrin repeat protein
MSAGDGEGQSLLHAAAQRGHLDLAGLLLESGADINVRNGSNESPLDVASRNKQGKVARFLAERMGLAVAPEAISEDVVDIDQPLLGHGNGGSNQHTPNDGHEMTLHDASSRGLLPVIRSLLDRAVDINSRNAKLETPLDVASQRGKVDVARLLIDRGADVNCYNMEGHTPLDASSMSGHVDVARLLLDHGAHVDTRCRRRFTPLHHASDYGHFEVVQLLVERGANVNAVGDYGLTPLQLARLGDEGDRRVNQLLIEHGAT